MAKIQINVFNLTKLNRVLSFAKVGVYHTSIVIDEASEYYYGFAGRGFTGIDSPEKINCLPSVMNGSFHSKHFIGESKFNRRECRHLISRLKKSNYWMSDNYNVLFHNCNKFTLAVCKLLLGEENIKNYPYWVERGTGVAKFLYKVSIAPYICYKKNIRGLSHSPEIRDPEPLPEKPSDVDGFPEYLYSSYRSKPVSVNSHPDFISYTFKKYNGSFYNFRSPEKVNDDPNTGFNLSENATDDVKGVLEDKSTGMKSELSFDASPNPKQTRSRSILDNKNSKNKKEPDNKNSKNKKEPDGIEEIKIPVRNKSSNLEEVKNYRSNSKKRIIRIRRRTPKKIKETQQHLKPETNNNVSVKNNDDYHKVEKNNDDYLKAEQAEFEEILFFRSNPGFTSYNTKRRSSAHLIDDPSKDVEQYPNIDI